MTDDEQRLFDYLQTFLTPHRRRRFAEVLALRTRRLTVVLEDVYHAQNVSAVLRTCDAFGIQDIHVIDARNPYEVNADVSLGTDRWLTVRRYSDPETAVHDCVARLRRAGYTLVATSPHGDSVPVHELDVTQPLALILGNEKVGLTAELAAQSDRRVHVPMYGFVESFNLSVAAALCLQTLSARLRQSDIDWRLTDAEREELLVRWTRLSIPAVEQIEARYRGEMRDEG
jgi:tRNA (guanosine-2'-O-)-methyltransferase